MYFLVDTRFHHVGQAGLELSSDPLTSASQSARIIGVSHCTQPLIFISLVTGIVGVFMLIEHVISCKLTVYIVCLK